MRHFVNTENDATSLHIGGGCGEVHEGEPGRVEICDACLAPAAGAGFAVESIEEQAPKKLKRRSVPPAGVDAEEA